MKNTLKRFLALFSAILIFTFSFLFPCNSLFASTLFNSSTSSLIPQCGTVVFESYIDIPFTFSDSPEIFTSPKIFSVIFTENSYTAISSASNDSSTFTFKITDYRHFVFDKQLCFENYNKSNNVLSSTHICSDKQTIYPNITTIYLNSKYFSPPRPEEPDFSPVLTPFIESTNSIIRYKTGFLEWLNTYGKLSVINSNGFKFVSSQLDLLVDVYNSYGNSPAFFFSSLTKTFNISTDIRGAYALLVTIRDLYQEYLQWKNSDDLLLTIPKPSVSDSHPHWRDQEDYNLVTDTEDDTPVISILRDILRTLIYLPQNIASYFNFLEIRFNDIIYNFQSLIYLLNNLPDQISSLTYNSLINPLTEIKDSINNIDVSSPDVSVDVTISDEKQNEINTFFSDWNVKYSTAINEKIPVISQLSGLFNDEFFEKCGIDTNGDGQVYQYYSTSVSYDSSSLSGTSSDSVSDNDDVVNLLCSQFDNSDPNFLDDVSYSEDVPSLSISIAGKKTEIFDFRLFAKYRTQIHTIMIFCIYSLYFLSLYKSLPSIIGNVSDVSNAFSDYKQSKKE